MPLWSILFQFYRKYPCVEVRSDQRRVCTSRSPCRSIFPRYFLLLLIYSLFLSGICPTKVMAQTYPFENEDNIDDFHVAADHSLNPLNEGWQVMPRLGTMRANIPTITMPGEIPFPVTMHIEGSPTVHNATGQIQVYQDTSNKQDTGGGKLVTETVNFAFPKPASSWFNIGYIDSSAGGSVFWLENGKTYDWLSFSSITLSQSQNDLLSAYGIPIPSGTSPFPPMISADGRTLYLYVNVSAASALGTRIAGVIGSIINYPTFLPAGYTLLIDKDRARVFAAYPGWGYLPVLILDRFQHYVQINWSFSGLATRIDVRNQRGQGFTIRQMRPETVSTTPVDLARLDFVGVSGPSMLVQGTSPGFLTYYAYDASTDSIQTTGTVVQQWIGYPSTVILGDPSVVPQPSWSTSSDPVCAPPATTPLVSLNTNVTIPVPSAKKWLFTYSNGALATMIDPCDVQTTFTTQTYSVNQPWSAKTQAKPDSVTGAIQAVMSDLSGHSSAYRTFTWSRQLIANAVQVAHTDTWNGAGADRTLVLSYGDITNSGSSSNNPTDYGNGFLNGWALHAGTASGSTVATCYRQSFQPNRANLAGTGGGLNGTLSLPQAVTWTHSQEASRQANYAFDSTLFLQPVQLNKLTGSATAAALGGTQVLTSGATYSSTSYFYNQRMDMLEPLQAYQIVNSRTNADGSPMSPLVTEYKAWDPNGLLELITDYHSTGDATTGEQSGNQYSYDAFGRLLTLGPYHSGGQAGSVAPRTTTIGYDDAVTGEPASWTTVYQDVPSGTGTIARSQGTFDTAFHPTLVTDEKGVNTSTIYDIYGRPIFIQRDGDPSISIAYPDFFTKKTTRAGITTEEDYDGFGRLIKKVLPDGRTSVPTYDLHGRLASLKETSTSGTRTSTTTYDLLDRVVSQTAVDGVVTTFTRATDGYFNYVNRRVTGSSPQGTPVVLSTITSKDPFGQVHNVQSPNGDTTTYSYDGWGNQTQVVITQAADGATQERDFSYDALGRLVAKVEPETQTQTFANFNGLNLATTFTEGAQSGSPRVHFRIYDGLGRLRSQSNGAVSESFAYTGAFLTGTTRAMGADQVSQTFEYEGAGARLSQETTNGDVTGAW